MRDIALEKYVSYIQSPEYKLLYTSIMIIDCIQLNTVKHSYTEHIYERWYKISINGSLSENSFVDCV